MFIAMGAIETDVHGKACSNWGTRASDGTWPSWRRANVTPLGTIDIVLLAEGPVPPLPRIGLGPIR